MKRTAILPAGLLLGSSLLATSFLAPIGPAAAQPAPGQTSPAASPATAPLAAPNPNHIMGADLRGLAVYGPANERIGDVTDFLIEADGRVAAFIVGVGGFLGIGQKDVAVPFAAIEIVGNHRSAGLGRNTQVEADRMGTGTIGAGSNLATGAPVPPPSPGASARQPNQGTVEPDRLVLLGMTRADLEAAPAFRRAR